jgi:hypothetical protein
MADRRSKKRDDRPPLAEDYRVIDPPDYRSPEERIQAMDEARARGGHQGIFFIRTRRHARPRRLMETGEAIRHLESLPTSDISKAKKSDDNLKWKRKAAARIGSEHKSGRLRKGDHFALLKALRRAKSLEEFSELAQRLARCEPKIVSCSTCQARVRIAKLNRHMKRVHGGVRRHPPTSRS